jgi:serine phosphatase RsbU (regulator of sigma subunit)
MRKTTTISPTATPADPDVTHKIGCMEIWGGNEAFDNAISLHGLDAWIYSRPYGGDARGGDIHYISTCGHGHIARFLVADVAGHGTEVGGIATELRRLMRRNINKLDQTRFVRTLNREFQQLATGGRFATAVLTSYFAPTHDLLICNAGHPRPMWYRADRGAWTILKEEADAPRARYSNLPIGVIDPTDYYQFSIALSPGDLVVLHSDGITEAKSPAGEMLGESGLLALAQTLDVHDPSTVAAQLITRVDAFRGHAAPDDDVTLIVLHHNGADPSRLTVGEWLKSAGKMMGLIRV